MSHKNFWPDRFSRFDVYWIQTNQQTNRQTDRQTDKPNLYIDVLIKQSEKFSVCPSSQENEQIWRSQNQTY